jgi:hypothetical protein
LELEVIRTFGYSHPELPRVEVPVGQICTWCREAFVADDLGVVVPHVSEVPNRGSAPAEIFLSDGTAPKIGENRRDGSTIPYHRECFMRQVVGSVAHQNGTCSCFGGSEAEVLTDLTPRQEAAAAVAIFKSRKAAS